LLSGTARERDARKGNEETDPNPTVGFNTFLHQSTCKHREAMMQTSAAKKGMGAKTLNIQRSREKNLERRPENPKKWGEEHDNTCVYTR